MPEEVMVPLGRKVHACKVISPRETYELAQKEKGILLLDVRMQEEYNSELGHVERTVLIPVRELEQRLSELEPYRGNTIVAICRSGNRSGVAAELLTRYGFVALNMEGGMIRWNLESLPVVRGRAES